MEEIKYIYYFNFIGEVRSYFGVFILFFYLRGVYTVFLVKSKDMCDLFWIRFLFLLIIYIILIIYLKFVCWFIVFLV